MPTYTVKTRYTVEAYEEVEIDSDNPEDAFDNVEGYGTTLCAHCSGTMLRKWCAEEFDQYDAQWIEDEDGNVVWGERPKD